MSKEAVKLIVKNRKAHFEYELLDHYEAGLVLTGTEVKSIRQGKVSLQESYISIERGEAYIRGMHIAPYEQGNRFNPDPDRKRKLLLHKREIYQLRTKVQQDGLTIVPVKLYFKNGKVKLEIALGRGKKLYDKRESIKRREQERALARGGY
ncbi:MAG: SsrA-binding protein SmpB [Eubacteriales bacterium]|nr:SsrA-binding protein SmpB [Eubacteriales bacterium]